MIERTHNLRLLVSKEERKMVGAIASERGLTVADVVRQLIRHEYSQLKKKTKRI